MSPDEFDAPLGLGPGPAHGEPQAPHGPARVDGEPQAPHGPARVDGEPPATLQIDPRPYGRVVLGVAVVLLVAFSVYRATTHTTGTIGVPAGTRLRWFAAPLAGSTLVGDANVNPPCTIRRHDRRALNICLAAAQGPLVLAFFVTASGACVNEVDTLQTVASRFRSTPVRFAAVAVRIGPAAAGALVRVHRWTLPVAYDSSGAVGAQYGVAVCPLIELARRGGVVAARLIGDHWLDPDALAAQVARLDDGAGAPSG